MARKPETFLQRNRTCWESFGQNLHSNDWQTNNKMFW